MNKNRKSKKYDALGKDWAAVQMSMTLEQEDAARSIARFARTKNYHMTGYGDGNEPEYVDAETIPGVTVERYPDQGDGISRGRIVYKKPNE